MVSILRSQMRGARGFAAALAKKLLGCDSSSPGAKAPAAARHRARRMRSRAAIVAALGMVSAPAASWASTGCTAINSGALSYGVTTTNTSTSVTSAPAAPGATLNPDTGPNGYFYEMTETFAAGDVINFTITIDGNSTAGADTTQMSFLGYNSGSGFNYFPIVKNRKAGSYSTGALPAGTYPVRAHADWFVGSGTHTVSISVSCAPGAVAPTLGNFTYGSLVAYNSGSTTATNIDVGTGGNVTNSPTGYTVSNASAGTYAASATTTGGGSVTINSSGVASYTPRIGYRGNDTFFAKASNGGGSSGAATVTVTVTTPTITATRSGTGAKVGTALSGYAVVPAGGNAPYSCVLNAGSAALPGGVTLASNCALTGTPTTPGTYDFNVDITDSSVTGTNGGTAAPFTISNVAFTGFQITQDAPTVTNLAPNVGTTAGNTSVVLTGTNFYNVTAVEFGATGTTWTRDSATQITTTSPAGSAGPVYVRVTTSGGTSATASGNQFTYSVTPNTPTVTAPANGATVGTTTPTYSGTADPSNTITVYVDNVSIGTTSSGSGTWNLVQPTALSAASHMVRATATNADGLVSANSSTNTFTVTPTPVASSGTASAVAYNAAGVTFSIAARATNSPTSFAVGSSTTAQGGSVSVDNAGLVTYTAPTGFRGNDSFTFTATNAGGTSSPATITVPVSNPSFSISLAGSGTRGTVLSGVQVNVTGGASPYHCGTSVASGALPSGTALNDNCTITGTPTASGTFNFTVTVVDSTTGTGPFTQTSGNLALVIAAPTLSMTPASGALPGATAGASYSQSFVASGGTAGYTYTRSSGTLPTGLTITGDTLSGTPTAVGTFNFDITAQDSSGSGGPYTVVRSYSITVSPPVITLAPTTLTNGAIGTAYTGNITASGGNGGYTYSVTSGALPAGVSLSASGAFSGTPTQAGSFPFTVTATDTTTGAAAPYGGSQAYTLTIGAPTITLSPASLPNATIAVAYSGVSVTASGGTSGYTYAITGGSTPPGIALGTGGTFTGTPTGGGTYNFTVTATDSSSGTGAPFTGSASYAITVNAPTITLSPTSLPAPAAGVAYSQTITATGGTGSYGFVRTSGTLPAGLTLATDGTLSGTPSQAGTFTFDVTATDQSGGQGPYSGTRTYGFTVAAATITVNPTTLPNGRAGTPYNQTVTASGGNGTLHFAVTAGALPPGWNLASDGTLSGTATASDTYSFTITATDSSTGTGAPFSGNRAYSVDVLPPNFTLSPPTLSATVGQPYTGNFVAGGGTAPYSYSRVAGTLPAGLTLAADGTLSGTPTGSGSFNFTVIARDSTGGPAAPFQVGSGYTFTVSAPTLALSSAPLAGGTVGLAYTDSVSASGGTAPYTYAATGTLPPGVTLGTNGSFAGAPTADGTFNFTVTATDHSTGAGAPFSVNRGYSITVAAPTLAISPTTLPSGTPGSPYSQQLTASGGTTPYTFTLDSGTLPGGVTLSSGGLLSGTPTAAGGFSFVVRVRDGSGGTGPFETTQSYNLTVGTPTITIDTATLPNATVAASYNRTLAASGGTAPYSFAVTSGALPAGLSLSTGGILSGTPTAGGNFSIGITATDSSGGSGPFSGNRTLNLVVDPPAVTLTPAVLNATVGTAYSQAITASGGTAGYTYAVTGGALPGGVTLAANGTLSGTPTAGGSFNFTVTATDHSTGTGPYTGSGAYTLTVAGPTMTLTPAALPNAAVGTPYTNAVSASGGTAPYSYAITAGSLPAGMTLSSTGQVSGTATAGGSFNFTITATDSSTGTGAPFTVSGAYTLTVGAPTVAVTPATLTGGQMEASYSQQLSGAGGTAPYSFALTAGALPSGLTLSSGGLVSGTPTVHGSFNFTVTATDSSTGVGPYSGSTAYTLAIATPAVPSVAGVGASVAYNSTANPIMPSFSGGGTATSIAIASAPTHGTATVVGMTFHYTPTAGYHGPDSFTYTASNDGGTSTAAQVSITVGVPPAPTVTDKPGVAVGYNSGGQTIDLSGSISGVHDSIAVVTQPAHGTTSIAGDVVTYTPTANYYGPDTFTFTATGPGGTSAPGQVTLTVANPPAPTVAAKPGVAVSYASSGTAIDLSGSISGVHNSIAVAGQPTHGTVTVAGDVVTYTPGATYYGPDSFTYTATGPGGTSAPAQVSLTVANPPAPVAADKSGVAVPYAGTGTAIDLSGSITGVHNAIAITVQPTHGTVSVAGDVVTYTPAATYYGPDGFTYTATGPGGTSAPAQVSLTVANPPAPVAADKSGVTVPYASTGTAIDLTASVSGVNSGIAIATMPTHGTVTVSGYVVTYVPGATYYGADSFTYTATGPGGTSAPATVSLTVGLPPAPVAAAKSGVAVSYNSAGTAIDLSGSVTGVHNALTISTAPTHGTATVNGDIVTYVPTAGYYGADSFAYTATGPGGTSAPATVSLTVATPPPPTASPGSGTVAGSTTTTGSSVNIDLSALVTGVYDTIQIATPPAHGTVTLSGGNAARSLKGDAAPASPIIATYTPAPNFVGTDSFTFVAVGPGGTSSPGTVTINVVGQLPIAVPKTAATGDGQMVSVTLTDGAQRGPFTGANVVSVSPANSATTAIVAAGGGAYRLDVTPNNRFGGTIVVTYTLSNVFGVSDPSTVTLTVKARPDPRNDPTVGAISDAQAETARRFARAQVSNFMRRTEQLHNGGGDTGMAMGVTLAARDGQGRMQRPDDKDWGLAITERMRVSGEDPEIGRYVNDPRSPLSRGDQLGYGRTIATTGGAGGTAPAGRGVAGGAPGAAAAAEPEGDGKRRLGSVATWAGGAIDIGTRDETTDRDKVTATTAGLSAGADIKLGDGVLVGLGGGYGNDLSRIGTAAQVRGTSTLYAAYASIQPADGMFIDGMVGRGKLDFTTRRIAEAVNATARGSRDGSYTVAAISLGVDRGDGPLQWSFYGRGEYMDADLDAYAETGAGRYNLRFDAREVRSITGTIGGRLQYRQKVGFGSITPRVRAEWNHEFADVDVQWLDYADIPGAAIYALSGNGWKREQLQLSLGTRFDILAGGWSFDFETGLRAGQGEKAGTLQLRLSKHF